MTPTQRQALEMALEALTKIHASPVWPWYCDEEISSIRAALAEQADDKADAERWRWVESNCLSVTDIAGTRICASTKAIDAARSKT